MSFGGQRWAQSGLVIGAVPKASCLAGNVSVSLSFLVEAVGEAGDVKRSRVCGGKQMDHVWVLRALLPASSGAWAPSHLLPAQSVWHCRAATEPVPVGRGVPSKDEV